PARSARRTPDGIRRMAMLGDAQSYWQLIPSEVGPDLRQVAVGADSDISHLRAVSASLALSCDGQVVAQLSRGRLALAWVDRARPQLDRWRESSELPFDDQEARLLAVALDFGDEVMCLFSTDRVAYRAEVSPTTELVVTETFDTPMRCATILAGSTLAVDADGRLLSGELDLGAHGISEVISLDAARSGGRGVYAVTGRDYAGSPIVAKTCSTGTLSVLPGLVADEVVVVRQLSAKVAPDVVLFATDGRLERIPKGNAQ